MSLETLTNDLAALTARVAALEGKDAAQDAKIAALEAETTDEEKRLLNLEIYVGFREGEVACSQTLKDAASAAGYDAAQLGFSVYQINTYLSTTIPHEELVFQDLAAFQANPASGHHVIITSIMSFTEQKQSFEIPANAVAVHLFAYNTDSTNLVFGSNLNAPDYLLTVTSGWLRSGPVTLLPQTAYYVGCEPDAVARMAFYAYVP
jgi:hypothetical protein